MTEPILYPRLLLPRVEEALADTPVLLIQGPRQCGKSTLARQIAERHGHLYLTLDDETVLAAARDDPVGFCRTLPERVIIDEVQRAPELFRPIKVLVDTDRRSGRFVLTGSANVMQMTSLSDSLAGRIEVLRLSPLAQLELALGRPECTLVQRLFDADFALGEPLGRNGAALLERVLAGGFPAALRRPSARRRRQWASDYVDALSGRDVRELADLRSPEIVPKLLETVAGETGRLFNVSDLASPFSVSRPTVRAYLFHLERLFLLEVLQPWHSNRLSRVVKTPKIHMSDTGLVSALLGLDADALETDGALRGQLLETFVYLELRRQASWSGDTMRFYHYRDKDKLEVDVVIERNGRTIVGVETKSSATIRSSDFRGIRRLQDAAGERFACGVVLHDGDRVVPFGERLFAVPFAALWEV